MRYGHVRMLSLAPVLALVACLSQEGSPDAEPSSVSGAAGPAPSDTSQEASPVGMPGEGILIKEGSLHLIVGDVAEAEKKLDELMRTYGAYVASRQSHAMVPGGQVLGPSDVQEITITLKVDAKKFDVFLARVKEIGSYTHEEIRIEDVTFAFMDLNARLSNQRKVEERLLGYLDDPSRSYKLVVEVERELASVREKIERLTTKLRIMENQIAYSTLVLHISVRPEWVPPQDRTFGQELKDTIAESLELLAETGRGAFILGLAVLPWLLTAAMVLYVLFLLVRLGKGRRKPNSGS